MSRTLRIRKLPSPTKPFPLIQKSALPNKSHQTINDHQTKRSPSTASTATATNLALTLPLPPSINHQYATVNGRRILSSKGRQYKADVAQQILSTLTISTHRDALLNNLNTHSLILSVWFYFASALRRDLDGGLKIAQDAICNAIDINDNRIGEIHLYRAIDATTPRMECILSIQPSSPLPRQKKKRTTFNARTALTSRTSRQRRS